MTDYNVNIDGLKQVGIFYIFARYILPVLLFIALIAFAVWAFYFYKIDLHYLQGGGLLLLLILILTIA